MKQEFSKNKELQDSLKKFREDAKKLEESKELKEARRKFESIEGLKTFLFKHIEIKQILVNISHNLPFSHLFLTDTQRTIWSNEILA